MGNLGFWRYCTIKSFKPMGKKKKTSLGIFRIFYV